MLREARRLLFLAPPPLATPKKFRMSATASTRISDPLLQEFARVVPPLEVKIPLQKDETQMAIHCVEDC